MQQRLPSRLDPPITFAHRGARAHAPENTLAAFELALRLGAVGLESDVWVTRDGVAVLDHDGLVRRRLKKVAIRDLLRAELPEHIPTVEELFESCGTGFHLSLDIKDPDACDVVVDVIAARGDDLLGRTWLCESTIERCVEWRRRHPDVGILNSTRLHRIKEGPERRAATLAEERIDGINLHRSDWNGGLVALFHRFDRVAFGWDIQFEHQMRPALRMGLDAVYSDDVEMMQQTFSEEVGGPTP